MRCTDILYLLMWCTERAQHHFWDNLAKNPQPGFYHEETLDKARFEGHPKSFVVFRSVRVLRKRENGLKRFWDIEMSSQQQQQKINVNEIFFFLVPKYLLKVFKSFVDETKTNWWYKTLTMSTCSIGAKNSYPHPASAPWGGTCPPAPGVLLDTKQVNRTKSMAGHAARLCPAWRLCWALVRPKSSDRLLNVGAGDRGPPWWDPLLEVAQSWQPWVPHLMAWRHGCAASHTGQKGLSGHPLGNSSQYL